jgi:hypothetical protein
MKKRIHKLLDEFVVIPFDLLRHEGLSLEAIGLATYICYLDMTEIDKSSATIQLWKRVEDYSCRGAYDELVREEIIDDVLGGLSHE